MIMMAAQEINNPYLEEVYKIPYALDIPMSQWKETYFSGLGSRDWVKARESRYELVRKYAWAIPTDKALRCIVKFAPRICEIGAGTGYWAHMLTQYGAQVHAFDIAVPGRANNKWKHNTTWFEVRDGDSLTISQYPHHALMLCWPPYSETMAESAILNYRGNKVIYIGEHSGGCTATDKFHEILSNEWDEVESVSIPQWDGIHDHVYLYQRKEA